MNGPLENQMCEDAPIVNPIIGIEKEREYRRKYRIKNPEKVNGWKKKWRENNREKHNAITRMWAKRNRKRKKETSQKWAENNRERSLEIHRKSNKKIYGTAKGNINRRMACGMNHCLKGKKRKQRWEILAGYTAEQLMNHIEKQFLPGMSWDNRSTWHIDHKIPISAFNFTVPTDIDFKKCWALENLQPLWSIDNRRKYSKLKKPFQPSLTI